MTDKITAALEAADKATPGPLELQESRDGGATYSLIAYDERAAYVVASINSFSGAKEGFANARLFAAAPDMAARIKEQDAEIARLRKWQEEALPYLNIASAKLMPAPLDFIRFNDAIDNIDRLIAEVEK